MKIDRHLLVVAMSSALALTTTAAAMADTVITTVPENQRMTYLYNYQNNESIYSTQINEAAQGTICHGLRVQPSGYVDGYTIYQIDNQSPRTIYMFTGPSCDGYVHIAGPGQYTQLDNSNYTSHEVLVKSYYYR